LAELITKDSRRSERSLPANSQKGGLAVEIKAIGAGRLSPARIGGIVAVVVLVLAAILALGEMRYQTCIQKAEAQFPGVPVSAFNGRTTGPLKVSFAKERADAVNDCGRL
jgi:hypothetical protein